MSKCSRHFVIKDIFGEHFIVSSLAQRSDVQIITIEGTTGDLLYTATPGVDLFSTLDGALETIQKPEIVSDAACLIGYVTLGMYGREMLFFDFQIIIKSNKT